MPRVIVVLPSQSYRATDFMKAGEELGIDLIVASEVDPPIEMGDRYLKIDCENPETASDAIVRTGDSLPIDGIVAADDGGVVVAAMAGTKLGLIANNPEAARATRNKALQRELLGRNEVPQPRWAQLDAGANPQQIAASVGYPLVIKPLDRSASQGVIRVNQESDLGDALGRVRDIFDDGKSRALLVEEFLDGTEVAVEGIISTGGFLTLAIFDKPDPILGEGFQESILVTPSRHSPEVQGECVRVATAAASALGLSHGPVHIELMVDNESVKVIEVAARSIGGLCSKSLRFGLMDTSLETLILRNALGRDKRELRRDGRASGVLMIPIPRSGELVSIDGLEYVRELDGITSIDITARAGDPVAPPPEGDRYLGFVFSTGDTPEQVESALKKAMNRIKVNVK
jgi:biotin carboxylase